MPTTTPGPTSGEKSYVRASAGSDVDARKVGRFALIVCVLALAGVAIATTVGAARQDSSQTRLQRDGVPVEVTVTGCAGYSSGIGQAVTYYSCRGEYTLAGHRYNEVIGGTRTVHSEGQVLRGVTVPGDPSLLSTATAVAKRFSPWTPYVTPIVLAALAIALALGLLLWPRWRRRADSKRPTVRGAAA
jgi:hypothetical protein